MPRPGLRICVIQTACTQHLTPPSGGLGGGEPLPRKSDPKKRPKLRWLNTPPSSCLSTWIATRLGAPHAPHNVLQDAHALAPHRQHQDRQARIIGVAELVPLQVGAASLHDFGAQDAGRLVVGSADISS